MKKQLHLYVSYLLRMWSVEEEGKLVWRSSLEHPRTGKKISFASLPYLFEFLEKGGGMEEENSSPPNEKGMVWHPDDQEKSGEPGSE